MGTALPCFSFGLALNLLKIIIQQEREMSKSENAIRLIDILYKSEARFLCSSRQIRA
jgi:hypothetical protein